MIQQTTSPRFYRVPLSDQANANTPSISRVWVADDTGLRLSGNPWGQLSIDSTDGSLGRLTVPQGVALDGQHRCFFVDRATGIVWLFDSYQLPHNLDRPFEPILNLNWDRSTKSRVPHDNPVWALSANSHSLFFIDPVDGSITVIALNTWSTQSKSHLADDEWPLDFAVSNEQVYLLSTHCIYIYDPQNDAWICRVQLEPSLALTRIIVDKTGKLHGYAQSVGKFFQHQRVQGEDRWKPLVLDRSRFSIPPVYSIPMDPSQSASGRLLVLGKELTSTCQRSAPSFESVRPPELSFVEITPKMQAGDLSQGCLVCIDSPKNRVFQTGERVRMHPCLFQRKRFLRTGRENGTDADQLYWLSTRIDSRRYQCHWDLIEIDLTLFPVGSQIEIATSTSDDEFSDPPGVDSLRWDICGVLAGTSHVPKYEATKMDVLVRSRPGQYLWVRIRLQGDGFSTPIIHRIFAKAPRQSYTEFLPAVMVEDDASKDFLDRFLYVFQSEWDRLHDTIENLQTVFDPLNTPASHLKRLADSLGIGLPALGTPNQQRNLLSGLSKLLIEKSDETRLVESGSARGTPNHLKKTIQAVVTAMTGLSTEELRGYPWIIEGFRERSVLHLRHETVSVKAGGQCESTRIELNSLAGRDESSRLRLGDKSRLGERQLLPPRRSELDTLARYAFRFRVVLPKAWLSARGATAALLAAIDSEKPVHTECSLELVSPGLCIGVQSTVGVDTILADRPTPVLSSNPPSQLGLGQGLKLPDGTKVPPPFEVGNSIKLNQL